MHIKVACMCVRLRKRLEFVQPLSSCLSTTSILGSMLGTGDAWVNVSHQSAHSAVTPWGQTLTWAGVGAAASLQKGLGYVRGENCWIYWHRIELGIETRAHLHQRHRQWGERYCSGRSSSSNSRCGKQHGCLGNSRELDGETEGWKVGLESEYWSLMKIFWSGITQPGGNSATHYQPGNLKWHIDVATHMHDREVNTRIQRMPKWAPAVICKIILIFNFLLWTMLCIE